jgi:hypothetical protein
MRTPKALLHLTGRELTLLLSAMQRDPSVSQEFYRLFEKLQVAQDNLMAEFRK